MATGFSPSYEKVSSLTDLYEKTATDVKTAIKGAFDEPNWLRDFPKERVTYSPNETRIPLVLVYPTSPAMIGDGGYEAQLTTQSPTSGTVSMTQMNYRFSYTGLAEALDARSKTAMIVQQTEFQSMQAAAGMGRAECLQLYGSSAATVCVVKTTGIAGTVQTGIALKNAFGSTLVAGGTTTQNNYLSNLIKNNEQCALIRSGALIEFGTVVASPSAGSGAGAVDITFNSSITPTVGDLLVFANAVTDATITGTDRNNAPIGLIDILTAVSVHGVSNATYGEWNPGYTNTSGGRFGFAQKEAMINGIANKSGAKMDRIIYSQGVRRDVIAGERGSLRYDNSEDLNLEGDLKGFEYLSSLYSPPGMVIGWFSQAFSKLELTNQPDEKMQPGSFKLDKVQDRSAMAAYFNYFRCHICSARAAFGYASGLAEQG